MLLLLLPFLFLSHPHLPSLDRSYLIHRLSGYDAQQRCLRSEIGAHKCAWLLRRCLILCEEAKPEHYPVFFGAILWDLCVEGALISPSPLRAEVGCGDDDVVFVLDQDGDFPAAR